MYISRIYYPYLNPKSLIIVKDSKFKYIVNVLRKKINDSIILFNGMGQEYYSSIHDIKKKHLILKVKRVLTINSKILFINIAQSLIKKKKFELILEKVNELGAFSFTPIIADFTTKNYLFNDNKSKMIHLEKKIISSCEQNGRNQLMILNKMNTLDIFCNSVKNIKAIKIYLQPYSKNSFIDIYNKLRIISKPNIIRNIFVVIGPEGGLSQKEILSLKNTGFFGYHIINNVLCSETASISAVSILSNLFHHYI